MPVSSTDTSTSFGSASSRMVTPPSRVNFSAFEMRLVTI